MTFHGSLPPEKVKSLLSRSHFYVLPSELEAFGIAALEARAAGLPVIAMSEGGVKEFIEHGRNGLIAQNDDELAAHILRLCVDRSLRETIARHNRSTPVKHDWSYTLSAHFATYERARILSTRDAPITRICSESSVARTVDAATSSSDGDFN
jgi:glycosyltransferase involved in cell wall biosynthesis